MESQEKLNDIICCPECYNSLVKDDILTCQFCKKDYPIYSGIPVPISDTELQNKIAILFWSSVSEIGTGIPL